MTDLLKDIDPGRGRAADPAALVPEHAARTAELEGARRRAGRAATHAGAEVLAGARTPPRCTSAYVALLGRERGVVTRALAAAARAAARGAAQRAAAASTWSSAGSRSSSRRSAPTSSAPPSRARRWTSRCPGAGRGSGARTCSTRCATSCSTCSTGSATPSTPAREVEPEEYNFAKLNFAPDHPARDAHDTYFVEPDVVLRTHTSPGWVRAMEERKPPLRLVFPGRVYRAEQVDASHMDQFHQIDGLFVGRDVSLADLKSTLNTFARAIYRAGVRTRLIPIYFPFVEPGAQLDVACAICDGTGRARAAGAGRCPVCKGSGWSELLGAGMVHPNVFRAVGYDPEEVTGFAFGMGVERIAMARYGIPEIRLFLENDVRFLNQF